MEAATAVIAAAEQVESTAVRLEELADQSPPRPPTHVTAHTPSTPVDEIESYLPDSYRERQEYHPHESPWTMTAPLVVLSVFAFAAG